MQHPRWQAGRLSTGFIAEEFPDGFSSPAPAGAAAQAIAAVAAAVDHVLGERKRRISGQMAGRPVIRERLRSVWLGGAEIRLEVARQGGGIGVRLLGETEQGPGSGPAILLSSFWKPGEPVWHGMIDGAPVAVQVRPIRNGFCLFHRGIEARAFFYTESESAAARLSAAKVAADHRHKPL